MAKTVAEIQEFLAKKGVYAGEIDGLAGVKTSEAIVAFQKSRNLTETGKVDIKTLSAMFPTTITYADGATITSTIRATVTDYLLNFVKSKSQWAATSAVLFITAWVQTRFGLTLPQEAADAITVLIASGFTGLIWIFQTFFNSPHMTNSQPGVVQRPAEHK